MKVTDNLLEHYLSSFHQELCWLMSFVRIVFEKSESLRKVISIVIVFELQESNFASLSNNVIRNQVPYFVLEKPPVFYNLSSNISES